MPHKAVRTITVEAVVGSDTITFEGRLLGSTIYPGSSVEIDKIAAYGDPAYSNIPRSVKSYDEFSFTVLDEGTSGNLEEKLSGKVATVTIQVTFDDGKTAGTPSTAASRDMTISHVGPGGEMSVDGDQKATIVITAVPHGPVPAPSTQN